MRVQYKVYYTTMLLVYADHYISPFEGSPRAGAVEYVQRGGCYMRTI